MLSDILSTIELLRHEGCELRELPLKLDRFLYFLQEGLFWSACGSSLIKTTQPTSALTPESKEYTSPASANEAVP
jgi:hypothetical protein